MVMPNVMKAFEQNFPVVLLLLKFVAAENEISGIRFFSFSFSHS